MAVDADGSLLLVDCGVMFPERDIGVDVIHPDFSYVLERRRDLRGVVITHGHEDHIGALPYLLRQVKVPVYGPPYALALIKERLREHGLSDVELVPTKPRERFRVGAIEVEPLRMTHSIADSTALVLRTPAGTIVHTGDFKLDDEPGGGEEPFDEARLREVGGDGVRLLLSDSTNADVPGVSGSERTVAAALRARIAGAKNRLVIAIFASNTARMRAVVEATRDAGKQLVLLGRGVHLHARLAGDAAMMPDTASFLLPPDRAQAVARGSLVAIATGTQGEPAAALARLAEGTHPALKLEPGDEVLLSSRVIPGSELRVAAIVSDLERRGIVVHTRVSEPELHVSGHAHRDEQRRMIDLVRPSAFVPVHGTFHHLLHHLRLAEECAVPERLIAENGAIVELDATSMRVVGEAPAGRIHVDAGEEIPEVVLRDRALLAELGVAVAVIVLDTKGRLARRPEVITRGVIHEESEEVLLEEARRDLEDAIRARRPPADDDQELRELARRTVARCFSRALGRKPLTHAVVVRTGPGL